MAEKDKYGAYSFSVNESIPKDFSLKDNESHPINLRSSGNKIVILDFWNTGCGICFQKFPIVQKISNKYEKMPDIQFYAVNVPLKRDTVGQAAEVYKKLNYSIPNLNVENMRQASNIGVLTFPTLIVLYHNKIIFRGDVEDVDKCIKNLL